MGTYKPMLLFKCHYVDDHPELELVPHRIHLSHFDGSFLSFIGNKTTTSRLQ